MIQEIVEVTVDDVEGTGVFSVETVQSCQSCLRPLKPDEKRGTCNMCKSVTCSCSVACEVCSRNLCGECRRGVVEGQFRLTVCPICLPKVERSVKLSQILAIQNLELRVLRSPGTDRLPAIGLVRRVAEFKLLRRLMELEHEIRR